MLVQPPVCYLVYRFSFSFGARETEIKSVMVAQRSFLATDAPVVRRVTMH